MASPVEVVIKLFCPTSITNDSGLGFYCGRVLDRSNQDQEPSAQLVFLDGASLDFSFDLAALEYPDGPDLGECQL